MNAILPARIRKEAKRSKRWKSTAHRDFVRSHACVNCGSFENRQVAHVRMRSGAGIGEKPDDWRTVCLCGGAMGIDGCHALQHNMGEPSFWTAYERKKGHSVEELIAEFIKASPRRQQIEQEMRERENAS